MRFIALAFAAVFSLAAPVIAATTPHHHHATPAPAVGMQEFDTESAAQKHCPKDEVVWLNTNSGIWHEKGIRWYGNTNEGAYVCKKQAAADDDRDTRNGQ